MMVAAVSATDDVSQALNQLYRTTHDHETISPRRRFNLAAILPAIEEETPDNSLPVAEELFKPAEHEYEPPEHEPKMHKPMPTGPVRTVHHHPMDRKAHPTEQTHPTVTQAYEPPRNNYNEEPKEPRAPHHDDFKKLTTVHDEPHHEAPKHV